ncbi:MAG TPA: ABATE domain-containing protein [Verrucomicrobiae bacterium]|nr:ABATE domain-containing protein [Verrucomicrobiae bacterium]
MPETRERARHELGDRALALLATGRREGPVTLERLASPEDLSAWLGLVGLGQRRRRADAAALAAAVELRTAIRRVLGAVAGGAPPDRADISVINRAARRRSPRPQLGPDGATWDWTGRRATQGWLALVAEDAVLLLAGPLRDRVRLCAAAGCDMPFVDRSRPGHRRWCSVSPCADRAKKAAQRRREAPAP